MISGHDLGFAFRKVKRKAIGLSENRREKNDEAEGLDENPPLRNRNRSERDQSFALLAGDFTQVDARENHDDSDDRQSERKLIADHLRSAAQATQKRVLVIGSPASHDDAVN